MEVDAGKILEFVRVGGVLSAVLILVLTWLTARILREGTGRLARAFTTRRLFIEQLSTFLRFTLYVVGTVFALRSMFAFSDEVLTVVGGTIVVTVGLVLKDQAASILAGIMLLIEKPFQVGDRVAFGGYYGEISSIGLRSVRLVTLDDNEVTIPNSRFLTDPVASGNSGTYTMLVQQDFFIGVDQDVRRAKEIVSEALTSSCYFSPEKQWTVLVSEVQLGMLVAVRLRSKAYVIELRYEKAFESDVAQRVLEAFQESSILAPALLYRGPISEEAKEQLVLATTPPEA